eukprot:tig00021127_g18877.t1
MAALPALSVSESHAPSERSARIPPPLELPQSVLQKLEQLNAGANGTAHSTPARRINSNSDLTAAHNNAPTPASTSPRGAESTSLRRRLNVGGDDRDGLAPPPGPPARRSPLISGIAVPDRPSDRTPLRGSATPVSPSRSKQELGAHERPPLPNSFWGYFAEELRVNWRAAEADEEAERQVKRERIYNFLAVPHRLEQLLMLGFFICADSFLFLFTFLPFRVLSALLTLAASPFSSRRRLRSGHVFDLLRAGIFLLCSAALQLVDVSQAYHHVRGQAAIKLYVIFNLLECFDKLFCSFGQDMLDSLFWSSARMLDAAPTRGARAASLLRGLLDFTVATVYMFLHAIVLFYQVVTLNVAVNSHNNALLTVLVSNNFVELKSSVFKKFTIDNLFQIACADMVERFQLFVYLLIVVAQNASNAEAPGLGAMWGLWRDPLALVAASIWFSECFIDWTKHAFVTKFNMIAPEEYRRFGTVLCKDLIASRRSRTSVDHSYSVSRRIGFVSLPLACVAVRVFRQVLPAFSFWGLALLAVSYACLWAAKILVGVCLLGYAARRICSRGAAAGRPEAGEAAKDGTLEHVERFSISARGVPQ